MAKKQLTIEEKLQAALVPAEEQPYKVPENWCWVYLLAGYAECLDKYRKPVNAKERAERIGEIPYYGATGQVGWIDDYLTDEQLVLLGEDGAPFLDLYKDKAYMIEGKAWVNNHAHILRSFWGRNGNELLVHYLNQFNFNGYVNGTTRLKLTQASMNVIPMVLPPRAEQSRIVARIESLFAKLDEAKEKIQEVLDGADLRRAAILHQAFTGKLTEKWRTEHGVSIKQWEKKKLKECGKWMGGGTPSMSHAEYWENGDIPWITAKDMKTDNIETTQMYTNMLGISNSSANYNDKPSVIFVMRSGILRRTLPIATVKMPYAVNQDLKAVTPEDIDVDYLFWVCESNEKNILRRCMKNGTTVESIDSKALLDFEVPIAPLEEQSIIVDRVVKLIDQEQIANQAAESALTAIDTLKKSILARAFRGELGTNDPAEPSAQGLLQEILEA